MMIQLQNFSLTRMIHSVYFWLNEDGQGRRQKFESALRDLLKTGKIQEGRIGRPAGTQERPVTDHSFDYSLILTFATQVDHDAYQDHDRPPRLCQSV